MLSCLIVFVFLTQASLAKPPLVHTLLGPVQGHVETFKEDTEYEFDFYSFEGIPFAKPPVGPLRFKPPEPIEPWTNTLTATTNSTMCAQVSLDRSVIGTEDCLYLNVFTPNISSSGEGLPVMMYIHGGGFRAGSGSRLFTGGPQYLMAKQVVLVTFNYRLGPLGFLSTEDKYASGNYGMLDQVAVLKWIQKNIRSFGGNPNKVTIFGNSAGSGSVHFHILSPLSKGLFHYAISESGTALSPWAYTNKAGKITKQLGEKVGCSGPKLIDCLRKVDYKLLLEMTKLGPSESWQLLPLVWTLRVDIEADSPFLPAAPLELISSGNFNPVPWITGFNRDEADFMLPPTSFLNEGDNASAVYTDWYRICRLLLKNEEFDQSEEDCKVMCHKIREYYISEDKSSDLYDQGYIDMISALAFSSGTTKSVELCSQYQPVYMYSFEFFSGRASVIGYYSKDENKNYTGVNHADELMYLFKFPGLETDEEPENSMVEIMTTLWTNFARTGVPKFPDEKHDPEWPTVKAPDYEYITLSLRSAIRKNYKKNDMAFLNEMLKDTWYKRSSSLRKEEL